MAIYLVWDFWATEEKYYAVLYKDDNLYFCEAEKSTIEREENGNK